MFHLFTKKIDIKEGKKVSTYSTAENTSLRLSETQFPKLINIGQPLETQICVFVNPNKTFQTYVGIGAALTDASAETCAKLSKSKQKEF